MIMKEKNGQYKFWVRPNDDSSTSRSRPNWCQGGKFWEIGAFCWKQFLNAGGAEIFFDYVQRTSFGRDPGSRLSDVLTRTSYVHESTSEGRPYDVLFLAGIECKQIRVLKVVFNFCWRCMCVYFPQKQCVVRFQSVVRFQRTQLSSLFTEFFILYIVIRIIFAL